MSAYQTRLRLQISIHAPREGSDADSPDRETHGAHFNPRSPRGERPSDDDTRCNARYFNPRSPRGERQRRILELAYLGPFQSTLPARGATELRLFLIRKPSFQSTLPARGATCLPVSISLEHLAFQSTLPARGATVDFVTYSCRASISIHAPREGSDTLRCGSTVGSGHFNPRSPRGERQQK